MSHGHHFGFLFNADIFQMSADRLFRFILVQPPSSSWTIQYFLTGEFLVISSWWYYGFILFFFFSTSTLSILSPHMIYKISISTFYIIYIILSFLYCSIFWWSILDSFISFPFRGVVIRCQTHWSFLLLFYLLFCIHSLLHVSIHLHNSQTISSSFSAAKSCRNNLYYLHMHIFSFYTLSYIQLNHPLTFIIHMHDIYFVR